MIDPQLVFQNPAAYLKYMVGANSEGQYFDRKEVKNDNDKKLEEARKSIVECISAFTNSRGGLIVLGISNNGKVVGLDHLDENQYNSLVKTKEQLTNHQTITKEFEEEGKKLLIFYSPEGLSGSCKTIGNSSKGWIRDGANNLPLTQHQEEGLLLERNKKWEQLSPCDFDFSLINKDVLLVFKKRYLEEQGSTFNHSDEDFLKNIGACKQDLGRLVFTNTGYLFFANNPSGLIPSAQVRFLRFDCESDQHKNAGTPSFDKTFDGCLPEMLRKVRTFVNEGALFKKYIYRNPSESGIVEEPELPPNAVEEAIVNALIHRDYNISLPIECILYKDAFIVRSPGKLLQPTFVPTHFDLDNRKLTHFTRNPKIVQWAKTMVDERGQRFVKQLSEGHQSMLNAMKQLGLPAPVYYTNGFTTVKLYNNYVERESRIKKLQQPLSDEYTNLFELDIKQSGSTETKDSTRSIQFQVLALLKDKLQNLEWFIDRDRAARIIAHQKGHHIPLDTEIDKWLRVFPAYSFQVYSFEAKYYLSIDFDIQLKNSTTLDKLYSKGVRDLRHRNAQVKIGGVWTHAIIEDFTEYYARVILPDYDKKEEVAISQVIPSLSKTELSGIARGVKSRFNLDSRLKDLSLSSKANASKERSSKITETAEYISKEIFPLSYKDFTVYMKSFPVPLSTATTGRNDVFTVFHSLKEPEVKFADNATDSNILSGLTKYGSYSSLNGDIEFVPFCISGYEPQMKNLIDTIKNGSMSFRGIERTFKCGIKHLPIVSKSDANEFLIECDRLIKQYDWESNKSLNRIFLIHIPEDMYPVTDFTSPYYRIKEFLLEKGIPVQMVDTPTLIDPKFKDFNLALNIVAKTGGTPWVLPNALPDVDLFIGLSYAQYKNEEEIYRTMGYANVFNKYGEWKYYKGNIASFDFERKHIHLGNLVRQTVEQSETLPEAASIHVHYSSKFSRLDREHIVKAVQSIRPKATVTFVWINMGHNVRMFDSRMEGNGSLTRGSYVITRKNQFFLSTTGYSTLKKTLGTPIMLEVNIRTEPYHPEFSTDYKVVAQHLLALTKLNWASTQSINGEPVTTKYAYDIARLSSAFYRRSGEFKLNATLEKTPWFI